MRVCAIIPAYDAERTVGEVVQALLQIWPERGGVFVIDDGSLDATAAKAREAGAKVAVHPRNRGKGAALRTGMELARSAGFDVAITVDADGQHPAEEAVRLLTASRDPDALVLGIRDLVLAGAPRKNQLSNQISNFFLSLFAGRPLRDTQCGLRRYPIARTLELAGQDNGYAFEAEIILRAIAAGVRVVEAPVRVLYPPEQERITHFDSVRDPARIVTRVVQTLVITRGMRRAPPGAPGAKGSEPSVAPRAMRAPSLASDRRSLGAESPNPAHPPNLPPPSPA
jgi:glycosyltransferase involved in cell wall biosynthesis